MLWRSPDWLIMGGVGGRAPVDAHVHGLLSNTSILWNSPFAMSCSLPGQGVVSGTVPDQCRSRPGGTDPWHSVRATPCTSESDQERLTSRGWAVAVWRVASGGWRVGRSCVARLVGAVRRDPPEECKGPLGELLVLWRLINLPLTLSQLADSWGRLQGSAHPSCLHACAGFLTLVPLCKRTSGCRGWSISQPRPTLPFAPPQATQGLCSQVSRMDLRRKTGVSELPLREVFVSTE